MIHDGKNRVIVQDGKGETDVRVLMALAVAGFDVAPRGLDIGNLFDASKRLTPEDVADLDLIKFSPGRVDLLMADEIFGRDCSLYVTQSAAGVFVVHLLEGWSEDLLLRAAEILPELIAQDRRIAVESPADTQ